MIYPYECDKCEWSGDIIKPMADSGREEFCMQCGNPLIRVWTKPLFIGTKVEHAEYNPGLGCVTKNQYHRREIAKRKGLQEVGSDYGTGQKMVDEFESKRKAKRDKEWDDL